MVSVTLARYGFPASPLSSLRCGSGEPVGLAVLADRREGWCVVADDPTHPRPVSGEDSTEPTAQQPAAHGGAEESDATTATDTDSTDSTDSPTDVSDARRPRSARDPLEAAVDAELAKRRRVVAVRLSEVEHLVWRGEAAADKRGQLGAWTRSVVAAEIARRHGADVPDTAPENLAGGAVVVLNESVVRELNQQLVRVGNLLNQVTRLAHTEARTGGVEAATMARVVSGLDQTRATIAALDGRLEDMSRR